MTEPQPWRSSGWHLLEVDEAGWLRPSEDFMRAYYLRPELRLLEDSCAREIALHSDLMAEPFRTIPPERLDALADRDAAENYAVVLRFRDLLLRTGSLEAAIIALARGEGPQLPPLFLDQMIHAVLAHILAGADDPMRYRAAELFFREQMVDVSEGRVLLADAEIVAQRAEAVAGGAIGQLLAATATPPRSLELDVLSEANKASYWQRSERFDTVLDFRFTQPGPDAFARVLEAWVRHFLRIEVRVAPVPKIADDDWRWHIGLDREASRLLDALYRGETLGEDEAARIIALFDMTVAERDSESILDRVRGRPIHLALAMDERKRLKMKPQNLIANMPLTAPA